MHYYCVANGKIPLPDFRRTVARAYLNISSISNPQNLGRPSFSISNEKRIPEAIRKDPVGHYLERTVKGKQRKCWVTC